MRRLFIALFVYTAHAADRPSTALNVVLLSDTDRSANQWPVLVKWAQARIARDNLLPDNYTFKWVMDRSMRAHTCAVCSCSPLARR
jgi:hypothetical protein